MPWQPGEPLPRYHHRFHKLALDQEGRPVHYVEYVEVPGCGAQGGTLQEALANLAELLPDHLGQLVRFGQSVPPANPEGTVTVGRFEMLIGPLELESAPEGFVRTVPAGAARVTDQSSAPTFSASVLIAA